MDENLKKEFTELLNYFPKNPTTLIPNSNFSYKGRHRCKCLKLIYATKRNLT